MKGKKTAPPPETRDGKADPMLKLADNIADAAERAHQCSWQEQTAGQYIPGQYMVRHGYGIGLVEERMNGKWIVHIFRTVTKMVTKLQYEFPSLFAAKCAALVCLERDRAFWDALEKRVPFEHAEVIPHIWTPLSTPM
jgi:hypothetical protein